MAGTVFLGPVFDRTRGEWATVSGRSLTSRTGPGNLSSECSAALFASAGLDIADTSFTATLDPLPSTDPYGPGPPSPIYPGVNCVGMGGTNLSRTGRWRALIAYDSTTLPARPRLAPNAIVSVTNLTGALADIQDDPSAPSTSGAYVLTGDGIGILHVGFATPTGTLRSGDVYQRARVRIRNLSSSTTHSLNEIALWETGSMVRVLRAAQQIPPGADFVLSGLWDANEISNLANLELQVTVTGKASELEIRAMDMLIERSAGPVTFDPATVVDTGWLTPWTALPFGDIEPSETWMQTAAGLVYWHTAGGVLSTIDDVGQIMIEVDDHANADGMFVARFARAGLAYQGSIADADGLQFGATIHPDGPVYRTARWSTVAESAGAVLSDLAHLATSKTGFFAQIQHDPGIALTMPFYARPRRNYGYTASSVPKAQTADGPRYRASVELEEAHERDWTVLGG